VPLFNHTMVDFSTKFVAEMLAMMVVITIGDGVIANEVLLRTKGHGLGMGHVSIAFGMAFFTAIIMFSNTSATVNPAMLLAEVSSALLFEIPQFSSIKEVDYQPDACTQCM
jgi:glycerol uptake facilitator-like aquaporin